MLTTILSIFVILFTKFFEVNSQVPFFLHKNNCEFEKCINRNSASNVLRSINNSADACDNFYQFACGNWLKKTVQPRFEPLWNNHMIVSHKITNRIQQILEEQHDDDNNPLTKAKIFYKACMNVGYKEKTYLKSLKLLVEIYKGFPLTKTYWPYDDYNVLDELMKIYKITKIQPILKINVGIDVENTTKNTIYIEPGSLVFPQHILLNPTLFKDELFAYEQWIENVVKDIYGVNNSIHLTKQILEIIKFEMKLAEINNGSPLHRTTIKNLSKQFPANWLTVFKSLFGSNIGSDHVVIIQDVMYFRKLFLLIEKTEKRIIANYLMWQIIKDLSRDTSLHLKHLSFLVDRTILGIQTDLPLNMECVNRVNEYFSLAIIPTYVQRYLPLKTLEKVDEVTNNIKNTFVKLVENTNWLSRETVRLAVEKINNIQAFIGYPKWVDDVKLLNEYYSRINISDNHFVNMLKLKRFMVDKNLLKLNQSVSNIVWPSNVFQVNSYYSVLQNSIFIPLGILEPPFFHVEQSRVLNYGALGSLIGHELSHALDTTGRQANKIGVIKKWWPHTDVISYNKRTQCFEDLFSNGVVTIGENIADSTGLAISFLAYENLIENESFLRKPIGQYSEKQIFFMSFGQMWCEKSDLLDIFNDEHASSKQRVELTLSNNDNFRKIFNCKKLDSVCRLW